MEKLKTAIKKAIITDMRKILMILGISILLGQSYEMTALPCVFGRVFAVQKLITDTSYRLAGRSVVKVAAGDSGGSGIIWEMESGCVIIAASRHLLRKDVAAVVTFNEEVTVPAQIMGYSQQYDVGFLTVPISGVPQEILQDLHGVAAVMYNVGNETDRIAFVTEYAEREIIQLGMDSESGGMGFFQGSIMGISFVPVFNTHMLETACYAKAGMSGGGVFDRYGRFLGLICGGEVAEDADRREADVTYSLPPKIIEDEYALIKEANEE